MNQPLATYLPMWCAKMIPPHNNNQRGFTLIEMMIAIAIFALLSLGAYQVLQGVLRSDEISTERGNALKQLQRAMVMVERDFQQMNARNNRSDDELTAMPLQTGKFMFDSDEDGIAFTRSGWRNPLSQLPRSSLQRVIYRVKDAHLERLSYIYLDPITGEEPKKKLILENVEAMTFEFYHENKWTETWTDKTALPDSVKVILTLKRFGEIERLFLLPKATVDSDNSNEGGS
ncbi:MAG: type II secretion system minor pseudopilin GspJ [Moritella sp.]|uniref:type II secretion system minor pseudopilin GspJ n=1 Tax=Moritella sp. TaxID=78556 RepID=UPI0029BB92A2|nr:type II secretion system minor pseudopilin GspJ [Moritella sp.]MDX2321769.1 type II secretion system minor pseudopilin GspJ [Moritella sp.]